MTLQYLKTRSPSSFLRLSSGVYLLRGNWEVSMMNSVRLQTFTDNGGCSQAGRHFAKKRQVTDPTSFFVHFFSMVAIVQMMLGKGCFVYSSEQAHHLVAGMTTVTGCCGQYFFFLEIK